MPAQLEPAPPARPDLSSCNRISRGASPPSRLFSPGTSLGREGHGDAVLRPEILSRKRIDVCGRELRDCVGNLLENLRIARKAVVSHERLRDVRRRVETGEKVEPELRLDGLEPLRGAG